MFMRDTYLTIQDKSEGIYTEKRSKFLAFAHPIETIDEIKDLITDYKKEVLRRKGTLLCLYVGA